MSIELAIAVIQPIQLSAEYRVPDVELDPVAIAIIGNRVFTEENYITSNQTVTESLDALDVALAAAFIGTIDGGSAGSVYLNTQETDGGGANTIFEQTINGGEA